MEKWFIIGNLDNYDKFEMLISKLGIPDLILSDGSKGSAAFAMRWAYENNINNKKSNNLEELLKESNMLISISKEGFEHKAFKIASNSGIKIIEIFDGDVKINQIKQPDRFLNTKSIKQIDLNGVVLMYDENHMTPILSFILELKNEIDKMKKVINYQSIYMSLSGSI